MYKCGYVCIVGRPNAGKSTLVNALVGQKLAIVSNKPQTTRDNILGVLTEGNTQMIFVDTPGVHKSKNNLDKVMMKNVRSALAGADVVLYLVDGSCESDSEELLYIEKLKKEHENMLVITTKIDKKQKNQVCSDIKLSSLTGENLAVLKTEIEKRLPSSKNKNFVFEEDYYTDRSVRFLSSEIIRGCALNYLQQEIPHGVAVVITNFKEQDGLTNIECDIVCENERHKGMILGAKGSMIKKIGTKAREEIEELLGQKVMLKLFVRVEKDWRKNSQKIAEMGYSDRT